MFRNRLAYLSLILVSLVLSLFASEAALRLIMNVKGTTYFEPVSNEIGQNEGTLVQMAKEKQISADTFNIYYFGESTMEGAPYKDTIPILVEKMLNGKVNGKQIKWINMGKSGVWYTTTADKIRQIVNKKDVFYPSLVLIYAGHNEYFRYHGEYGFSISDANKQPINWLISQSQIADLAAKKMKLYKLEIDERSFFDKPLFSNKEYADVATNYDNEISKTISYLEKNKVPVIISTVAGNYSGFEPNRSVFECDESRKIEFKEKMDDGLKAEKENKLEDALNLYKEAQEICGTFAQDNYKLGELYEKTGNYDEAWAEYNKAVDNDKMPIRAVSSQNQFIKNIKENSNTKVVDSVEYLRNNSQNKLIGYNLMSDGQHPNILGHKLISELFAEKIAAFFPKDTTFSQMSDSEAGALFEKDHDVITMERAEWIARIATWTYDPTQRLQKANEYLDQVIAKNPNWARLYLDKMMIMYLEKDKSKANNFYKTANDLDPVETGDYMKNPWISQIIYRALAEK